MLPSGDSNPELGSEQRGRIMSNFLKAGVSVGVVVLTAGVLVGCQPQRDEALDERLAALDKTVAELRTEIHANQARILKEFRGVKGGQQTMIRRGIVVVPDSQKKPILVGDNTHLPMGDAPTLGDPGAPVEVIEFAEFQCPFCMKHQTLLRDLVEEYPGKVRSGFKHFPLSKHKQAVYAGKAAWAAGRQDKFWEMHDLLFSARGKLNADAIDGYAEELGLDMDAFKADVASGNATQAVFTDRKAGHRSGVKGTPSFYVNGRYFGNDPAAVREAIEAALGTAPAGGAPEGAAPPAS